MLTKPKRKNDPASAGALWKTTPQFPAKPARQHMGGSEQNNVKPRDKPNVNKEIRCYNCQLPGHVRQDCKTCSFCGKFGHQAKVCQQRIAKAKGKFCQKCGKKDSHSTSECHRKNTTSGHVKQIADGWPEEAEDSNEEDPPGATAAPEDTNSSEEGGDYEYTY